MGGIEFESPRFFCQVSANELVRRESAKGLHLFGEVVSVHEVCEMASELVR